MQAFEAINEVVRYASADTLQMVVQLIPLMITKLNQTLSLQTTTADSKERQSELQVRLSGVHYLHVHTLVRSFCVQRQSGAR